MSERRLARHLQPQLSEERVARQWRETEERSQQRGGRARGVRLLSLGLALVAAVVFVMRAHQRLAPGSMEGAVLEGGDVVLPDGSQIAVDSGGKVRIAVVRTDRVELGLVGGAMNLVVPHGSRRVVVHAGAYDVVDLGTRFRVALGADGEVRVEVIEGSVDVRTRHGATPAWHLDAGARWSSAPPATTAPPIPSGDSPAVVSSPTADDAISSAAGGPAPGPRELLESAERARLAGHLQAAAAALDALRRRYRRDPRAALAAFELGRLRLDSLRDAPGAVEALTDAILLAPRGPLREDAEARRVEALAAEHSPECATARDGFLQRYPRGVHQALIAGQCGAD